MVAKIDNEPEFWVSLGDVLQGVLKLQKAFDELQAQGITGRQDFWCCNSCGHHAIKKEMRSEGTDGYTFYNGQATDQMFDSGTVMLQFGGGHKTFTESDDPEQEVGRKIVEAIEKQGLQTKWNGDAGRSIEVVVAEKMDC